MKPLKERLANVLRTKIFMGDRHNSYENIVEAIFDEMRGSVIPMNGDEMKEQIGKDMVKVTYFVLGALFTALVVTATLVAMILF